MRFVGCDISTKTGLVCLDSSLNVHDKKLIQHVGTRSFERVHLVAQGVANNVLQYRLDEPLIVFIEGYALGNRWTKVEMVELGFAIRYALWKSGQEWWDVPPSVLKKWATGKGNSDKNGMAKAAKEQWQFESEYDDIVDAYCLARMAAHVYTTPKHGLKITKG